MSKKKQPARDEVNKFNETAPTPPSDPELKKASDSVEAERQAAAEAFEKAKKDIDEKNPKIPGAENQDRAPGPDTMFDAISGTIIKVFADPGVSNAFRSISSKLEKLATFHLPADKREEYSKMLGENITDGSHPANITKELVEVTSTAITYAIFAAIGYYDDFLKEALEKDFSAIASVVQEIECKQKAMEFFGDDVNVLKAKLAEMEKKFTETKANESIQ